MEVVSIRSSEIRGCLEEGLGLGGYVYIGRKYGTIPQSPLFNPFIIGKDGDRELVIKKFKSYCWELLKSRPNEFSLALERLSPDSRLVCWCSPEPCHGDILISAYDWLKKQS